jgi:hypothetical protein
VAEGGGLAGGEAVPVPATLGEVTGCVGGAADGEPGPAAGPAPPPGAAGWCGAVAEAPLTLLSGWALIPAAPAPGAGCCGPAPGSEAPARAGCPRDGPVGPGAYRTTTGP